MKKFEYVTIFEKNLNYCFNGKNFLIKDTCMDLFNLLGSEGWELVNITENIDTTFEQTQTKNKTYFFKRELLDDNYKENYKLKLKLNFFEENKENFISQKILDESLSKKQILIEFLKNNYSSIEILDENSLCILQDIQYEKETGVFSKRKIKLIVNKKINLNFSIENKSIVLFIEFYEKYSDSSMYYTKSNPLYFNLYVDNIEVILLEIKKFFT